MCENRDFRSWVSIRAGLWLPVAAFLATLPERASEASGTTLDSGPSQFTATRNKPVFRINYFVRHEVNMIARCVGMLVLAGALLSLTGCNTVAGFGQDISGASRSVQRAL